MSTLSQENEKNLGSGSNYVDFWRCKVKREFKKGFLHPFFIAEVWFLIQLGCFSESVVIKVKLLCWRVCRGVKNGIM